MKEHKRYNIGILIGGVYTYFPKEHISNCRGSRRTGCQCLFFLETQTKRLFREDKAKGTHKNSLTINLIQSTITV